MIAAVEILQLDLATLEALASGDLVRANRHFPVALNAFYIGPECLGTWRMRAEQVAATPADQPWVTAWWRSATRSTHHTDASDTPARRWA
jgi:hypothetical protein